MPPQMDRMATLVEWESRTAAVSMHVVPVTSSPVTTWLPRGMSSVSLMSLVTTGAANAMLVAMAARNSWRREAKCIFPDFIWRFQTV